MADYGSSDTSTTTLGANQFPISEAWTPNAGFSAVEGGTQSTDSGGKKSAPVSMSVKDGSDVTQGTSTDANTINSVMGRLTKIRDLLNATLTVGGTITEANSAAILAALDDGQENMANSISVAIASDQSAVPVSGTFWQATQPVSGTVTANQGGSNWTANIAQIGGTNIVTGGVAGLIAVGGPVASAGTNADNPVKIGSVFNTTQPTVTTGQIVDLQATARGASIVSTGVDTFNVTVNAALPAGTNVIGHAIIDSGSTTAVTQATASSLNAQVVGAVASAGANAGNPLKTGGVFNTTQPTVTNGQIVDNQTTARGAQIVATGADTFNATINAALPAGSNVIGHVIADSGSTTAVTGTVAVTESGTWTVQPGNTANTTPWLASINDGTTTANNYNTGAGTGATGNAQIITGGYREIAGQTAANVTSTSTDLVPSFDATGYSMFILQLTGTFTMTLQAQWSNDNVNFISGEINSITGTAGATGTGVTTTGMYLLPKFGRYLRIRPSAWTSNTSCVGTLGCYTHLSPQIVQLVTAVQSGTWTVQPGNTPNTTPWVVTQWDGQKTTYSASYTALAGVAGDLVVLGGSGTKTVKLIRMEITGSATAATLDFKLDKRSTADTVGTKVTAATIAPHDSNNAAATGTIDAYSAAPTQGTSVGIIRSGKLFFEAAAAATASSSLVWEFGVTPAQCPTLRGTTQQLALVESGTLTSGSIDVDVTWTEE